MPRAAIQAGIVHRILALDDIAADLVAAVGVSSS
jgi:chemotaxis response regulator CheB